MIGFGGNEAIAIPPENTANPLLNELSTRFPYGSDEYIGCSIAPLVFSYSAWPALANGTQANRFFLLPDFSASEEVPQQEFIKKNGLLKERKICSPMTMTSLTHLNVLTKPEAIRKIWQIKLWSKIYFRNSFSESTKNSSGCCVAFHCQDQCIRIWWDVMMHAMLNSCLNCIWINYLIMVSYIHSWHSSYLTFERNWKQNSFKCAQYKCCKRACFTYVLDVSRFLCLPQL